MEDSLRLQDAKVAWVLPVLGVDGNLLYNKPLLESLAKLCGSFRIFTAEFKGDKDALGFNIELSGSFKRLYQNERIADFGAEDYASGISLTSPSVIRAILKYQPDLMVIHEFSLWSLYAVFYRCMNPEVRVLLMVEAAPRLAQNRLTSLSRKILRTLITKKADTILTNNHGGRNYLTSVLHVPVRRVIVKPYLVSNMASISGISKNDLLDYKSSRGTGMPVRFLYVGQLLQRKGLQYALKSLAALLPENTGRFIFEVVGDGPFREYLEKQTLRLGLTQHVRFHGRQPYKTLWEWYFRADVFLFPTLADYRALVPFEALSMGLPIVASILDGGFYETVDEGRNGFSFDPRDTEGLFNILVRFIKSPELISPFGIRSLEMAEKYTLECATESLAFSCQQALDS